MGKLEKTPRQLVQARQMIQGFSTSSNTSYFSLSGCTAKFIENNVESREGIRGVLSACVRSAGKSTSVQ